MLAPFLLGLLAIQSPPENLALTAKATAFEHYGEYKPENANDGNLETRWSGIPGHNTGGWYQLDWPSPVKISEVIIRQYGSYTHELDVQIWTNGAWKTLNHHGKPGERLRNTVVSRFSAVETTKLRLGNITNGPTFREVEVYSESFKATKLEIHAASDLQGNIVGIVTDSMGAEPVPSGFVTIARVDDPPSAKVFSRVAIRVDQNGMFSIPMRRGMKGKFRLQWSDGQGSTVEMEIDAADFLYGLTELGYKPKVELLDGTWKFKGDPPAGFEKPEFDDSKWRDIKVPAHWEMEGFVVRSGHGGYRKEFTLPPRLFAKQKGEGAGGEGSGAPPLFLHSENEGGVGEGDRLKVRFDSVYSGCAIYCNGVLVARHTGGATPFEADLTDVAKPGRNVIAVDVQEHTVASEHLDKMSKYAYFHLAGIWRSVYLFRVPEVHIQRFEWTAKTDGKKGEGTLRIFVANESSVDFRTHVEATLTELGDDKPVGSIYPSGRFLPHETLVDVQPGQQGARGFRYLMDTVKPWTAETPNLYNARIVLKDKDGHVIQTLTQRVGFRETTIRGTEFLVNGTPVKFKGTCHHDQHPLKGRAVNAEDERLDLEMMKEANLNAVRTSHYPPHPSLPEIADELGLYVEAEAPFCWTDVSNDLRYAPLILQLTAETIQRDRNHPSVTWWSLANESEWGWGFERAREWAKEADPSRPHSAATSADLDIATLHNPLALSRIEDAEKKYTKPLIFDESLCIFQGIWGDVAEMWVDPGVRDYYVAPYKPVMEAFFKSKVTQGSFIWCWSDDIFCVPNRGLEYGREATRSHFIENSYLMPGRGLVGDAPWGVVDGWRRRKPEFWHIKMLHSPIRNLVGAGVPNAKDGEPFEYLMWAFNGFDFIDLAQCRFLLRTRKGFRDPIGSGSDIQGMASAQPGAQGVIRFPGLTRSILLMGMELFCFEPGGRLVHWRPLQFAPGLEDIPDIEIEDPIEVWESNDLSGNTLHVAGTGFEYAISRDSGLLKKATASGIPLMLELPILHVLPTANALMPLPEQKTWKLDNFTFEKGMDAQTHQPFVLVRIKGTYDQWQGTSRLKFFGDGYLFVDSEFRNLGDEFWAREVGLRFSVPKSIDTLHWQRDGEWPAYPSDHLGRNVGTTRATPALEDRANPDRPNSADSSPMGTNDFRSTKRDCRYAWIGQSDPRASNPDPIFFGEPPRVEVHSNEAKFNLRAMVESDRISVHVNDFYGGTGAGLWEWELNYGKGKLIKKGDTIKSKLRLRLVGG